MAKRLRVRVHKPIESLQDAAVMSNNPEVIVVRVRAANRSF